MSARALRFLTAGSVDDGKSTLIGRLLYDTKAVLADQLAAVARTSQKRGTELDLAECFALVSERPARIMRKNDYGIAVGNPADFVVWDSDLFAIDSHLLLKAKVLRTIVGGIQRYG